MYIIFKYIYIYIYIYSIESPNKKDLSRHTLKLGVTIGNSNNKTYEMMNTTNKNDIIDKPVRFLHTYRLCAHEEIKFYLLSTGYQNLKKFH